MSALLDIQSELGTANARVAALERELAVEPGLPSIAANLRAAVRIQKKLQSQFMEAASRVGVEVCRYRAFADDDSVNAGPVMGAIADFQKLFSVVFGSLKYKAKQRATVSSEVQAETAFQFGFAFSGSVGVVMTMRSDANIFDDSYIEDTLGTIANMVKANAADVRKFAEKIGPGAVNALYRWANDSAHHGLGAEIEWRRGSTVRGSLLAQRQELSKLRTAIEKTGSPHEESVEFIGKLLMADSHARRFKFKRGDGLPIISGTSEPGSIDDEHEATVPRAYKARIRRTTRLRYAKGTKEVRYHLLKLTPIKKHSNE